jgi:hypothetical protein
VPAERHPLVPHAGAGSPPTSSDGPSVADPFPVPGGWANQAAAPAVPSKPGEDHRKVTPVSPVIHRSQGLPRIVRWRRFPCEVPCRVRLIAGQEPGRSREITAAKC